MRQQLYSQTDVAKLLDMSLAGLKWHQQQGNIAEPSLSVGQSRVYTQDEVDAIVAWRNSRVPNDGGDHSL